MLSENTGRTTKQNQTLIWILLFHIASLFSFAQPGPPKYILVETPKTWHEAMACCRSKHTDLVSVRNLSENNQISSLLSRGTWIGLHRKTWPYWSDESPNIFTKWATNRPEYTTRTQQYCASVSTASGKWFDSGCGTTHHFFCQSFPPHQHEARFKLKFQSEADLNDPAVQQQILEQVQSDEMYPNTALQKQPFQKLVKT